MSPNVGNFVHDLVEMAKAMETLPQVQAELDAARSNIDSQQATVQRLELKLMERANELTELQSRIRSLEVERDDAQFHALEADDRTSRALDFIKATFGNAGSLIQALEPARPAEPVTETTTAAPQGERALDPTGSSSDGQSPSATQGQSEPGEPNASGTPAPASVETANPTSNVGAGSEPTATSPAPEVAPAHPTVSEQSTEIGLDASLSGAQPTENVSQPTTMPSTPVSASPSRYSGKTYSQAKRDAGLSWKWPNQDEWLANGGTIDNFFA